jgi:orotidine-5'-phosphate decarboxylase
MPAIPIIALDVPTADAALELLDDLGERCKFYKVGNELFTAAGPDVVAAIRDRGCDVFLDLKFHDIPNTVSGGVRSAARMGARLVTVHAIGGLSMLRAAVDAGGDSCGVLAVTVLTSLDASDIVTAWGREKTLNVSSEVTRLAGLSAEAGVHGVVCSGREAGDVHERFGDRLSILVPGVRQSGAASHDQARVVSAKEAADAGARYIVIGRMVTAATDRRAAMDGVLRDVA